MKKILHKSDSRGSFDHGWLKTKHSFSFADYHNPEKMRFGLLRVINDDIVEPSMGFPLHPHDNMEIITIPITGSLKHTDSEGHEQIINPGDIQIMSAGTGIMHSEYNASDKASVNLLQIWIYPKVRNIAPRYDQKYFDLSANLNQFVKIVSPEKNENSLWLNQDAEINLAKIEAKNNIKYTSGFPGNGYYIFLISGNIIVEDEDLTEKDAIGIYEAEGINISAKENSFVLLLDVPMD
ncbi:MAG: pirin family protein [FCB group bacterium]|jgi:redox-sensitive bicupin YhaK (pirin superfamily)